MTWELACWERGKVEGDSNNPSFNCRQCILSFCLSKTTENKSHYSRQPTKIVKRRSNAKVGCLDGVLLAANLNPQPSPNSTARVKAIKAFLRTNARVLFLPYYRASMLANRQHDEYKHWRYRKVQYLFTPIKCWRQLLNQNLSFADLLFFSAINFTLEGEMLELNFFSECVWIDTWSMEIY